MFFFFGGGEVRRALGDFFFRCLLGLEVFPVG